MNLQKKLQNIGIEQIAKINPEFVRLIAFNVTEALTNAFPAIYEQYNNILAQLINCNMYTAQITKPISKVNYIYENNSIYIDENIDLTTINEQIIHECIHYLQDSRNKNGKLNKIGLCNFGQFSVFGLGINEAIVQYISAKTVKNEVEIIEKYGVRLKTISPNYYPFLTSLIEQIAYLMGEDILVIGILYKGNKLEDELLNTFEANTKRIINQFDIIVDINNKLNTETNQEKIKIYQEEITAMYIDTQNKIFSTFFEKTLPKLTTCQEVDYYMDKAVCYRNVMGVSTQERFLFGSFYDIKLEELISKYEKKKMQICRKRDSNTLTVISDNKIMKLIRKIIVYFSAQKDKQ